MDFVPWTVAHTGMCPLVGAPVAMLASSSVQMFVILPVKLLDITMKSILLHPLAAMKVAVCVVKRIRKNSQNAKKVSKFSKNTKKGTFGIFSTIILSLIIKKIEGGHFEAKIFFRKNGGAFSLARYCVLSGKTGKTFLVQFARPNGSI